MHKIFHSYLAGIEANILARAYIYVPTVCLSSENSDQPLYLCSLVIVFAAQTHEDAVAGLSLH